MIAALILREVRRGWTSGGVLLPVAFFLLVAVWRLGRDKVAGQRWLASAWGCACGMGYFSFFGQRRASMKPIPGRCPRMAC